MTTRTRPKKPTTAEREPSGGAPASRNRKPGESGLSNEERKTLRKLGSALRSKNYPLDDNLRKCRELGKNFQKLRDRSKKWLWAALGELFNTVAGAEANGRTSELREKVEKDCNYKPTRASNIFIMMCRTYLDVSAQIASTYAMALGLATHEHIALGDVPEFLEREGGVNKCAEKFSEIFPKKKMKRVKPADGCTTVHANLNGREGPRMKFGARGSALIEEVFQKRGRYMLTLEISVKNPNYIFVKRTHEPELISEPKNLKQPQ